VVEELRCDVPRWFSVTHTVCQNDPARNPVATPLFTLLDGTRGYLTYQTVYDWTAGRIYGVSSFIFRVLGAVGCDVWQMFVDGCVGCVEGGSVLEGKLA
jgi:hypothetical protein